MTMKRFTVFFGVSLVAALCLASAAPGWTKPAEPLNHPQYQPTPVAGGGVGQVADGASCYRTECSTKIGLKACFVCCLEKCTDATVCQDKCDGTSVFVASLLSLRGDEQGSMLKLSSEIFEGEAFSADQMDGLEWFSIVGTPRVVRFVLVTASDRYISAAIDPDTRARLRTLLVDSATDQRSPSIRSTAFAVIAEAGLQWHPAVLWSVVSAVVGDADAKVRARALKTLLGAKGPNSR